MSEAMKPGSEEWFRDFAQKMCEGTNMSWPFVESTLAALAWAARVEAEMVNLGPSMGEIERRSLMFSMEMQSARITEQASRICALEKALELIHESPGGGPGKRIATQALARYGKSKS